MESDLNPEESPRDSHRTLVFDSFAKHNESEVFGNDHFTDPAPSSAKTAHRTDLTQNTQNAKGPQSAKRRKNSTPHESEDDVGGRSGPNDDENGEPPSKRERSFKCQVPIVTWESP